MLNVKLVLHHVTGRLYKVNIYISLNVQVPPGVYPRVTGTQGACICHIFRKCDAGSMDWIYLAQDMDRWQASVKTVMNFRVS